MDGVRAVDNRIDVIPVPIAVARPDESRTGAGKDCCRTC
jgi:hypothetical protein